MSKQFSSLFGFYNVLILIVSLHLTNCEVVRQDFPDIDASTYKYTKDFPCPPLGPIKNGHVKIVNQSMDFKFTAVTVVCDENFTLIGNDVTEVECIIGEWKFGDYNEVLPRCERRCSPPPYLENGSLDFEKKIEDIYSPTGTYLEGTMILYKCNDGFTLTAKSSHVRVCSKGIWQGVDAFCEPTKKLYCTPPPYIPNGFLEYNFGDEQLPVGRQISYQCDEGYKLIGDNKIKCSGLGIWTPEPPVCRKEDFFSTIECAGRPLLDPNIHKKIDITSVSKNVVEISCKATYRNVLAPCKSSTFYCNRGKWIGTYPRCENAYMCTAPPPIPYGIVRNHNFENFEIDDDDRLPLFPINAQITYECLKGYTVNGSMEISCQPNGCWEPLDIWPTCIRIKENYFVEIDDLNALLITSAIGVGVLGILLLACLVVACKKRRSLARAVSISTTSGGVRPAPDVVNDHTVLLQHPDRLALIAFAEGVQNNQNNSSLPSYDEATRDRSTGLQCNRLQIQRPHWPNLAVCRASGRTRGSPNIEAGQHIVRHGSFASHTPSMRSGGESMGSTETMTISEGSTNITLDTASSHSAISQNPSCRGHCGSLTSFDACSIVNTEGIPLLEESELEEVQAGAQIEEFPDNNSCKISTHSGSTN